METKKSPLSAQTKRRIDYGDDRSQFRAVTEEIDGNQVRKIRGYAILFGVLGKPWRGSVWQEKVASDALDGVDLSRLVLLLDHSSTWVLGRNGKNMRAVVDEVGLFIEATLGNTWMDDYVYDRIERELMDGMSFYFDSKAIIASDWENKIDVIAKINEIYEVSVLAFPAYDQTLIITTDGEEPEPEADPEEEAKKQALINLIEQL
ncbi:HK97 family phage prohead protease [Paenibacillus whitsoniae]|nr:HK97 family phage prohead protease [Paenibacillus whitsoniae]